MISQDVAARIFFLKPRRLLRNGKPFLTREQEHGVKQKEWRSARQIVDDFNRVFFAH